MKDDLSFINFLPVQKKNIYERW